MSASAWEVRNSATLTFTALIVRTVGFKNVLKVHCLVLLLPMSQVLDLFEPCSLEQLSPRCFSGAFIPFTAI